MADQAENTQRSAHRNFVYCLLCYKAQDNLPVHLARVCMKKSTAEERGAELQKARASNREWIRSNRTWDYNQLCELLTDRHSRITMMKELLRRGFFVKNQPQERDMTLDPEQDSDTSAPDTTAASSSTQETECSPPDQEDSRTSSSSSSVWMNMKKAGLHQKLPEQEKLLVDFKKYLSQAWTVSNRHPEVDNVSRFLRYMQPTGDEPTLDFLSKITETRDFVTALQHTDMSACTILNYFKSINKFLKYLQTADPQLQSSCENYRQLLSTLRKTVVVHSNTTNRDPPSVVKAAFSITDCQRILREAKQDFLMIAADLQNGLELTNTQKTMYRYYCEAVLIFRHMQRPQAVESLTDAGWVKRIKHKGRVVLGTLTDNTTSMQIALTQDEEAWFQLYYRHIRPDSIQPGMCSGGFFLSSSGEALYSVSQDMNRFNEMYKLPNLKSQDVRRAVCTAAKNLTADQQKAVRMYLACGTGDSTSLQPSETVDTAVLLDSLSGCSTGDETITAEHTSQKTFSAFVTRFTVSMDGQPPCKKQRVDAGFPGDLVFYHKWRARQYAKRVEYLLSHFTVRKPTAAKVARLITREGWKANYPKPEKIERLWKPVHKVSVETDTFLIKCVCEQVWPGLAIKDFGEQGQGVVATRPFSKGEIVCDYHGKVITAAEGRAMMAGIHDEAGNMFFFRAGQHDLCIDAQTYPCECHPHADTIGRRIKHSAKRPNLKPFQCVLTINGEDSIVVLFRALQDISVDTQLKFDYGVTRKSFGGEDLTLEWLDE